MKDEIEEILDRLERIDHKEYSCGFEFADSGSFDEDCRCFEERKKLADYITNLQEENAKLKQPQIFIDTMDMEERYGQELYEDYLKEQLKNYKSRIDKAKEYIYTAIEQEYDEESEYGVWLTERINNLKNILRGSDSK